MPLARLLDKIENHSWQVPEKVQQNRHGIDHKQIQRVIDRRLQDILRIWDKHNHWFPVAAQIELSGDDHMDGDNFLKGTSKNSKFVPLYLARRKIAEMR